MSRRTSFASIPGKGLLRSAAVLVSLLGTPGLALAGVEGVWTYGNPKACRQDADNVMVVRRDRFVHYETSCRFGGKAPKGFQSVDGTMQCNSEGDDYAEHVRLEAEGNRLTMTTGGDRVSFWKRCKGVSSAAGPASDGSAAQAIAGAAALGIILGVLAEQTRDGN